MRRYTNNAGVPLSLAVYLATDSYDYAQDPRTISATSLLKPLKQLVLASRVPPEQGLTELISLVQSRMGSSIHDGIERSWLNGYQKALASMGYPQKVIDRVLVNPTPDQLYDGCIPVYLEQRTSREIAGRIVTGKFDFVGEGRLEDFKSTSVFTYMNNTKDDDYTWQGSIYRWLNPTIITQDEMAIQFLFTDWSAAQARANPKYPQQRTLQRTFRLRPVVETEHFILDKIRQLDRFWLAQESDLPACTDEDLWRSEPVWKYYRKADATGKSTKNFSVEEFGSPAAAKQNAYLRMAQDGNTGKVIEYPGKAKACKYCPAFPVCHQAQSLVAAGDLDV